MAARSGHPLDLVSRTIHGEPWNPDWLQSRSVQEVTNEQWRTLRAYLRRAFNDLKSTLENPPDLTDPMMLRGVFALAPHAAHHLGTIRLVVSLVTEA